MIHLSRINKKVTKFIPKGDYLLGGASIILLILVVLVVVETIFSWRRVQESS